MKILMIYPQYPDTFWSYKHALRFISKKAAVPPLGLMTVSAMLPVSWEKKLIDLNVTSLKINDLDWADYVFISAMYIQKESVNNIIEKCIEHKVKMIAGGPLFTQEYKNYPEIDHFVLNEAEITLPLFLKDLENNQSLKNVYKTDEFADITSSPIPDYYLLAMKKYALMNIQFTRGCPFACDFCEITSLFGHHVRMKTTEQILNELEMLYNLQWRGPVSIVDDNFIGRKNDIKNNLLPAMKKWMQEHNYPFIFNIQSTINLADDEELMSLMTDAGFYSAFIGIETPDENSLHNCNKVQNINKNMIQSVRKLQEAGFQVSGGFIVGFDSDLSTIFQRQIDFIQQSGIVSAMVGLLNAPKNTRLYHRLKAENRLTTEPTGSNTDSSMNFIPKMNYEELMEGYKRIIKGIYDIKPYYKRIRKFLLYYKRKHSKHGSLNLFQLVAFFKTIFIIGVFDKGRGEYWKLLIWTLIHRPGLFTDAVTYIVFGYHYRTVYGLKSNNRY
ncbi:B12-binding domain-containing radical SAM protein [Bacteroidota bacterium]